MKNQMLLELEKSAANFMQGQTETLLGILHDNQHTEYGKRYGFDRISSIEEFRNQVPVTNYDDYEAYIDRMLEKGEHDLITAYPIRYYIISSGTTGTAKHIPMTEEGITNYERYSYMCAEEMVEAHYRQTETLKEGWNEKIFLINEIRKNRLNNNVDSLLVSSAVFERKREMGQFDFKQYTSPEEVLFPKYRMDMNYLKLRFALSCADVTAIEGVYVHQILNLMCYLEKNWEILVEDIASGSIHPDINVPKEVRDSLSSKLSPMPERGAQLREVFQVGFDEPVVPRIWKQIRFIMAISGSAYSSYMKKMRRYIGDVPYHHFIYAASEGIFGTAYGVNLPDNYLLAPKLGFFEFIPEEREDTQAVLDASGLEQGEKYELVYTGFAGFYRYRMGDIIEVIGFYGSIPLVKFCYRRKQCVNIAGEKMDMESIAQAVEAFAAPYDAQVQDFCVYPNVNHIPGRYEVFLEWQANAASVAQTDAATFMDKLLRAQNLDYDDCRNLAEIDEPVVYFLKEGTFETYKEHLQSQGVEMGQYKPIRILDTEDRIRFFFGETKR